VTGAPPDLLALPHHDGSALYVSNPHPAPGDTVRVLVRVPHESEVTAVHLRTAPDAEQQFSAAVVDRRTDTDTWWSAELTCHNPVTGYRFLLEGGATSYAWLNGTGVHLRDVPDAADFRLVTYDAPPAWALDEETALVHCARSAHAPVTIPARRLTGVEKARSVYGAGLKQGAGTVSLVADQPQVDVWVWPTL
jgi:hypothetical protein